MKNNKFTLASILISALFAFSIVYFISGVVSDKKNGPAKADEKFEILSTETEDALRKFDINSYEFSSCFIKAIGNISDFSKISLTVNGNSVYSFPPVETEEASDALVNSYSKEFTSYTGNNVVLKAQIYTINQASVFNHAKVSFIIILAGTIIAALILIFSKNSENTDETSIVFEEVTDYNNESENSGEEDSENYEINESSNEYNPDEDVLSELREQKNDNSDAPVENENQISTVQEEMSVEENGSVESEAQTRTLMETLEEKIVESSSNSSDLSIIVIKGENLSETFAKLQTIVNENTFAFMEKESAVLVMTDTNLDEALEKAEELRVSLLKDCTMGISARTMRIISAERLLTEAIEAEKHAEEDPNSPVIAFRVNPEKYREFLLKN